MKTASALVFPPFTLDVANEQLWRETQLLPLPPKPFALLRYLVEHANRLVTKEEVLQAIWRDTSVAEEVLNTYIRQLRRVLGDEAKAPRYIETVIGRGYRFLAPLTSAVSGHGHAMDASLRDRPFPSVRPDLPSRDTGIVGRAGELQQLWGWWEQAQHGQRQLVFVTGEPGLGKTTVVDAFLTALEDAADVWIGRGQCLERYGEDNAYLPVLEALRRLGRGADGQRFLELLSQQAPTWLLQMPTFLSDAALDALQRRTQGATRERMLLELAEGLEFLTATIPLIVVVEDLQWSDQATLEALACLARRREAARLLILGTYRSPDVSGPGHPLTALRQELGAHGRCHELALAPLGAEAVAQYLTARCGAGAPSFLPNLAVLLHRRTGGNPLFLVHLVDDLIDRGVLVQSDTGWTLQRSPEEACGELPESLRQLLAHHSARLSPAEQQLLEAASIAGNPFSAAAVAAALATEVSEVEEHCAWLARQHRFVRPAGLTEWPDGTVTECYAFLHALSQHAWHERVSSGRRQQFHHRIGERQAAAYGDGTGDIAAELAVHFEQGRDYRRAVHYLGQAAQTALHRLAYVEAIAHLTKGVALVQKLPETPARAAQELTLQIALGAPLLTIKGHAAPEVERTYARARALCSQVGETPQLFPALLGLLRYYAVSGQLQIAHELGEQCLGLAQHGTDPSFLTWAQCFLGETLFYEGQFPAALAHLTQGLASYDPQRHRRQDAVYGQDPKVGCLYHAALSLWLTGYPAQALARIQDALCFAQELASPFSLAGACTFAATVHQFRGEAPAVRAQAEAAQALATAHGFPQWGMVSTILLGWALVMEGNEEIGIAQLRHGLEAQQQSGALMSRPYFLALLAEAYQHRGQYDHGRHAVAEAFAVMAHTGEQAAEAELYRLQGELTLRQDTPKATHKRQHATIRSSRPSTAHSHAEAEEWFRKALASARRQQAKSWELRAVMSLCRLWRQQGKQADARRLLTETHQWFTEGFDTADLAAAATLLAELRHESINS